MTNTDTPEKTTAETSHVATLGDLGQRFYGTAPEEFAPMHSFRPNENVILTLGSQFLVDSVGAHWLIVAVLSYMQAHETFLAPELKSFGIFDLVKTSEDSALLKCSYSCDDSGENVHVIDQKIGFTDIWDKLYAPVDSKLTLWAIRQAISESKHAITVLLPSEY